MARTLKVEATYTDLPEVLHRLAATKARAAEIECEHVDVLRRLAIPTVEGTKFQRVTFEVPGWTRPLIDWNGKVGFIAGTSHTEVTLPARRGTARVVIETRGGRSLAVFARAAYAALAPSRSGHGAGMPEIVTVDGLSPRALGLFESPNPLSLLDTKEPHLLEGVRLPRADVAVTDDPAVAASLTATLADPTRIKTAEVELIEVSTAEPRARVDLHVHRPTGWLLNFEAPRQRVDDIRWNLGEVSTLTVDRGDLEPFEIELPMGEPLTARHIDRLHLLEEISLDGVPAPQGSREAFDLGERLVELSASGVILHSLPAQVADGVVGADSALVEMWQQPYTPALGLTRDRRSVAQRRQALRSHSPLLLAAEQGGAHRALAVPSVSLVMSSMRPDRVLKTLRDLDAQTYPNLEIVLVGHGRPIPAELRAQEFSHPVHFVEVPSDVPFGTALATGARRSSGDLVMKVDDDDLYGAEFVWDIVLAYLYSSANIVGKTTEYMHVEGIGQTFHRKFAAERYSRQVAGGAMLMSRGDLEASGGWRPTTNSTDRSVQLRFFREGMIGYRTSSLGYVYIRHDDGHTWHVDMGSLIQNAFEQWAGLPTDIYPGRQATRP
ncbi:glycosyltransferase family 2 protein [Demequina sp. NBRC 110054]|uniref:glycosyltransferase n=1 Tax=Demequina sp. NBRC 110054 TaxID=1570343 RepID=UPI0009FC25AA|nr:glycosyltransferase [Demequina sp. NBRC 110054]